MNEFGSELKRLERKIQGSVDFRNSVMKKEPKMESRKFQLQDTADIFFKGKSQMSQISSHQSSERNMD